MIFLGTRSATRVPVPALPRYRVVERVPGYFSVLTAIYRKHQFISFRVWLWVKVGPVRPSKTRPGGAQKPARPDYCVSIGSWVFEARYIMAVRCHYPSRCRNRFMWPIVIPRPVFTLLGRAGAGRLLPITSKYPFHYPGTRMGTGTTRIGTGTQVRGKITTTVRAMLVCPGPV